MSTYAINIDWMEEFKNNYDKWRNVGRELIEENCNHKTQDKDSDENNRETNIRYSGWCDECGVGEDSCQPMMNHIYPLETEPTDEKVLKIVNETNLTVMQNTETDEYFLVLCGGGMDLSQDIALAYIYAQNWIPEDLIREVCTQPNLSVSGEKWVFLANKIIEQLGIYSRNFNHKMKEWEVKIKENER